MTNIYRAKRGSQMDERASLTSSVEMNVGMQFQAVQTQ